MCFSFLVFCPKYNLSSGLLDIVLPPLNRYKKYHWKFNLKKSLDWKKIYHEMPYLHHCEPFVHGLITFRWIHWCQKCLPSRLQLLIQILLLYRFHRKQAPLLLSFVIMYYLWKRNSNYFYLDQKDKKKYIKKMAKAVFYLLTLTYAVLYLLTLNGNKNWLFMYY